MLRREGSSRESRSGGKKQDVYGESKVTSWRHKAVMTYSQLRTNTEPNSLGSTSWEWWLIPPADTVKE